MERRTILILLPIEGEHEDQSGHHFSNITNINGATCALLIEILDNLQLAAGFAFHLSECNPCENWFCPSLCMSRSQASPRGGQKLLNLAQVSSRTAKKLSSSIQTLPFFDLLRCLRARSSVSLF
jgi:hypothetical protein